KICFTSLSRAFALLVATCLLVSGLAAAETQGQSRVRIQAVTPAVSEAQAGVSTVVKPAAATAPAAFRPVVKAAGLAVFQPAIDEPLLAPPPPEQAFQGEPTAPSPLSDPIPLGEEPPSPSDQQNRQRNVDDDRGRLSAKDNQ